MAAIIFRLLLLAIGMGLVETGLLDALARGSALAWLMAAVGFLLLFMGSAGFMGPLLERRRREGPR